MPSITPRRAPARSDTRRAPARSRSRLLAGGVAAVAAGAGLLGAAAPALAAPVEPNTLLARGSVGPAVSEVQHALHLHASGRFTEATRRAVVHFQRRHHLLVDGIVGPQTWDALFHITPRPLAPTTSTATTTSPATSSYHASSYSGGQYSIPSGIVQCESGGNYSAVNPSSGAGGAYQILPSTWRAYGGQGLPQEAPPAEQDRIAGEIYAHQGSSAWTC